MSQFDVTRDAPACSGFCSHAAAPSAPDQRVVTERSNVLTIAGTVASQIVVITAFFYYFGWVYAYSFFDYFGIDTSVVSYNTADYVLRSINVAFVPFVYVLFASLALFGLHRLVMVPALKAAPDSPLPSDAGSNGVSGRAARRSIQVGLISAVSATVVDWVQVLGRWRLRSVSTRWIIGVFQGIALVLVVLVFAGVLFPEQFGASLGIFLPLLLMLGVGLLGYVAHVRSTYPEVFAMETLPHRTSPSRAYTSALLVLGFVAALWAMSLYGDNVGTRRAAEIAAQLSARPRVVIYSTERIALKGPGIDVREITQPGTKFHYQYTGLRLLTRSSERFLLLPMGWQRGHDRVFLLSDGDSIRIDIETQ